MSDSPIAPEVWSLVDAMLDERILPDEVRQLEATLDGNLAAQAEFVEYCQLHVNLQANVRAQKVVDDFRSQHPAPAASPIAPGAESPVGALGTPIVGLIVGFNHVAKLFVVGALLMLVAVVVFTLGSWRGGIVGPSEAQLALASENEAAMPNSAAEVIGSPKRSRETATPIKSIRLQSGTATLAIDNVGTVVIEGPADFDLISPMRARLGGRGRMRMRVTERTGRGFVVETPSGEVTDLGTEFGLDLSEEQETGLVVFQGMVDLRVSDASLSGFTRPERLVEGEGVVFAQGGRLDRINSIFTANLATFQRAGQKHGAASASTIANVSDRERSSGSKKFYEIVTGGMREDAVAYVDRPHQWNGISKKGIPPYLLGADYVKTFNSDHLTADREIEVTVARPSRLFVFFDDRLNPPAWLTEQFRNTGDKIGLDGGPWGKQQKIRLGAGPGILVDDKFSVWERVVTEPTVLTLGSNASKVMSVRPAMYGIAALAMPPAQTETTTEVQSPVSPLPAVKASPNGASD